ncbi:hypothetical protein K439DRAFT_1518621 [Ramaria rubella]|nr:hypothetical protein K439DRAFT_1518621 [Ramaria rubella]
MSTPFVVESAIDEAFQDTVVEAFFSGLYTALFFVTLMSFYKKRTGDNGSHLPMILVTIVMYILSTIHFGYHWYLGRHAFVRNDKDPQSVFVAFYSLPFWGRFLGSFVFAANTLIADCLFIWRCWTVWNRDWRVVLLPILTTIIGSVFSGLNLAVQDANATFTITGHFIDTGTPYLALSLTTTLLVTILISYRIWSISSGAHSALEKPFFKSIYSTAIETVVESALLYSISLLIMVVLIVRKDPTYRYLEDITAQIVASILSHLQEVKG